MKLLKLVPDNTNIHFLKWRVPFYLGSLLLMAASLGLVFTKGLNLGVDFVGGQMIRVTFERSAEPPWPTCAAKGQARLWRADHPALWQAQRISIRMKLPENAEHDAAQSDKMARTITADIKSHHADARIDGVDSVSGKVSKNSAGTRSRRLALPRWPWPPISGCGLNGSSASARCSAWCTTWC
jgi:preprotein translocase subunit SecF